MGWQGRRPPYMVKACLLLLVLTNAKWRVREIVRVDALEFNHYGNGTTQLIAWENRPGSVWNWPQDWTTSPRGCIADGNWHDASGVIVRPDEWIETVTPYDRERKAFSWHRENGETELQGGIWRGKEASAVP